MSEVLSRRIVVLGTGAATVSLALVNELLARQGVDVVLIDECTDTTGFRESILDESHMITDRHRGPVIITGGDFRTIARDRDDLMRKWWENVEQSLLFSRIEPECEAWSPSRESDTSHLRRSMLADMRSYWHVIKRRTRARCTRFSVWRAPFGKPRGLSV